MASKYNIEGRVPANYPGAFNARENRLISHNYAAIVGAEDEDISLASDDGITHVVINAASAGVELNLPRAELSKGRLVCLKVEGLGDVNVLENSVAITALAALAAGSYQILCTGSDYIQVF